MQIETATRRGKKNEFVRLTRTPEHGQLLRSVASGDKIELRSGDVIRFEFLLMSQDNFRRHVGGLWEDASGWGPIATVTKDQKLSFEGKPAVDMGVVSHSSRFMIYRLAEEPLPFPWITPLMLTPAGK